MSLQSNQESDHPTKMMNVLWCFSCDAKREGKTGAKCPRCGSNLVQEEIGPSLNKERLAFSILTGVIAGLLVFAYLIPNQEKRFTAIGWILFALWAYSALTFCCYGLLFFVGGYFGMPSGRALFQEYIPIKYPEGRSRRFALRRLGMEALKSFGILAGGMLIFGALSFFQSIQRGCSG